MATLRYAEHRRIAVYDLLLVWREMFDWRFNSFRFSVMRAVSCSTQWRRHQYRNPGPQVVANVFQWSKLQSMVERSFLVQEFRTPQAAARTPLPALQPAAAAPVAQRPAPRLAPRPQQLRRMSAFARKHSVTKSTAVAAEEASAALTVMPAQSAAAIAEQVQQAAETALGGKLTRSQPLVDAGMDSLGEPLLPLLPPSLALCFILVCLVNLLPGTAAYNDASAFGFGQRLYPHPA